MKWANCQELRTALADKQIQPYFQPQICLNSGRVVAAEALARWIKPNGDIVSPGLFIPLIDELGLSDSLFDSMLLQVGQFIVEWQSTEDIPPISINISAQQLRNPDFVASVRSNLAATGVAPTMIKLELTESALMEDLVLAKAMLQELVSYGIVAQIDDFGTGYSSLSYLAELPVQALKIDRSFISRILDNKTQRRLVSSIIALGHGLDLTVVAEGVENEDQLAKLRDYRCDIAQGYLIGTPVPANCFLDTVIRDSTSNRFAS